METSMSSLLPPEFAEQLEDARFLEEVEITSAADARFIEDGEFFNIMGFSSPTEFEVAAQASAAPRVIDTTFVDGLIGAHVDASIQRAVYENWLFSSEAR
jgi:hypothetical protein